MTLLDQPVSHAPHFSQTFVICSYHHFVETIVEWACDCLNKTPLPVSFKKRDKNEFKEPLILFIFVNFKTLVNFKKCFHVHVTGLILSEFRL